MTAAEHKIYARHQGVPADRRLPIPLIKRCVRVALQMESVDVPCEVSVLITDDGGIRKINSEFRGIDKPTDVLSFPMQELTAGDFRAQQTAIDPESGLLPLGDIVLSMVRVAEQAREYGHSRDRETAYLVVHSVLHLLGYDHMDEAEEKRHMREREKHIVSKLGYMNEKQL